MRERGRGGGFILVSEVGVLFADSRCWLLTVCMAGGRAFWFDGVDGGRIAVG